MDAGQRHKFIQQLLKLASDPERRRLATDLFNDHISVASPGGVEPKSTKKLWTFWGSTPVWGGIGVIAGAIASQLSLKLLFVAVWGIFLFESIRVEFFSGKVKKVVGNVVTGILLAAIFLGLYRLSPKPKESSTLDQEADAVVDKAARKFPWLANPPKQDESKPTSTVVVSAFPKLKISLTSGKRDERTLILDNTKGNSKLEAFIITGLEYYLDMRGVAVGQARIEQRNPLPGPLNFDQFDIEKGATKRFNLNQGQSGIAIHMHDPQNETLRTFDDMRRYICLRILFTQSDTAETWVHYLVMSPYGDLFLMAEQPEHSGSGPSQKAGDEGWPYSIVRVVKQDARDFYGTEYREYQP
jgi:hypothetical protein